MKARKKARVQGVAKMIVEMVQDGMKAIPQKEQERRLKSFCGAFGERPRTQAKPSGSSQRAQGRMVARGRA